MENTPPPRRRNQERNYTRNANNTKRKRTEEKESKRNENGDGNLRGRQLVFSKVQQLEDTVNRLQQIQDEDKNNLLDQIEQLKTELQRLKWYIDVQLGTVELHSKPNDLKY